MNKLLLLLTCMAAQASLRASQTHVTNTPKKSFVVKWGNDGYKKLYYDEQGKFIKWTGISKNTNGYFHGFSSPTPGVGLLSGMLEEVAQSLYYEFQYEFNTKGQIDIMNQSSNSES